MALLLVVAFLVVPVVELAVIVRVAGEIGVLNTVGVLLAVSVVGAWLAKHQGLVTLRRIQAALARSEMPSREVADGALILLAGALMIAPGFVSDAVAIVLLIPPSRALVRQALLRTLTRRGRVRLIGPRRRAGPRPQNEDVWDVESWEESPGATRRRELRDRR